MERRTVLERRDWQGYISRNTQYCLSNFKRNCTDGIVISLVDVKDWLPKFLFLLFLLHYLLGKDKDQHDLLPGFFMLLQWLGIDL